MPQHEPVTSDPPEDRDSWLEESEELPRRPRRRLLGTGGNPVFLGLLFVLLVACGFIGGVLVEKGETSSSSSTSSAAASLASRFRALRGGTGTEASTGAGAGAGAGSGFTRPTSGTVAYLAGRTLYVTTSEGNTVRVSTSAGTSVSKTVKSSVAGIHPGETVTVTGSTGANGAVSAETISVGSSGAGLAALFGGSAASSSRSGSSAGSTPSLFGSG